MKRDARQKCSPFLRQTVYIVYQNRCDPKSLIINRYSKKHHFRIGNIQVSQLKRQHQAVHCWFPFGSSSHPELIRDEDKIRDHPYITSAKGLGGLNNNIFCWRWVLYLCWHSTYIGGSGKASKCADVIYGWFLAHWTGSFRLDYIPSKIFWSSWASNHVCVYGK